MPRLWSLQYLRALAAVAVVVYHVLEGTTHRVPLGAAGVDVFFVLSGFLMFALTARRPVTPARFLLDRVLRIVPLYWIATLLVFAAAWASRDGIHLVSRSPALLIQSLLFLPRSPATAGGLAFPTLFVGWTLDDEMFFYAVFAVLLVVPAGARIVLMSAVFFLLVAAGALLHSVDGTIAADTNPIILEFLYGAWIAALLAVRDNGRMSRLALAIGLLAVFGCPIVLHALPRSLFASLAVGLVIASLLGERAGLVPALRPFRFLGDASYAIYLFQILAFRLAEAALFRVHALVPAAGRHTLLVAEIASALALGCLVHVAIEKPLLRLSRDLVGRRLQVEARIAGTA